jgi:hypothetical protein
MMEAIIKYHISLIAILMNYSASNLGILYIFAVGLNIQPCFTAAKGLGCIVGGYCPRARLQGLLAMIFNPISVLRDILIS